MKNVSRKARGIFAFLQIEEMRGELEERRKKGEKDHTCSVCFITAATKNLDCKNLKLFKKTAELSSKIWGKKKNISLEDRFLDILYWMGQTYGATNRIRKEMRNQEIEVWIKKYELVSHSPPKFSKKICNCHTQIGENGCKGDLRSKSNFYFEMSHDGIGAPEATNKLLIESTDLNVHRLENLTKEIEKISIKMGKTLEEFHNKLVAEFNEKQLIEFRKDSKKLLDNVSKMLDRHVSLI